MKFTAMVSGVALPLILTADSKVTTRYQMAGQSSESTAYNKGARTRFEPSAGVVLIQQCDTKRMIAVDTTSRTYSISPLDVPMPEAQPTAAPAPVPEAKGDKVLHRITFTDTGETRIIFGRTARHIKTLTLTEPGPQACERKKMKIETDGWYIDGEHAGACSLEEPARGRAGCNDDIKAEVSGSAKLGMPVAYTMVMTETGETGSTTTTEVQMEVLNAVFDPLDAALFEAPAGFTEAGGLKQLAQQAAGTAAPSIAAPRKPGVSRFGIAAPGIRSGNSFAVDGFRQHLVAQFAHAQHEAYPVDGNLALDRTEGAKSLECDYLLETDLVELKKSTSKFGGIMKAASMMNSMGAAAAGENYEAKVDFRLISLASGSQIASGSVTGKTGGDFSVKTAMSLASTAMAFAPTGMMAKAFMANPKLMSMMMQNPALNGLLGSGMGAGGMGMGGGFGSLDPSAMAYMGMAKRMQSAMNSGGPGLPQAGPDESAAIKNALANLLKAVNAQVKKR
jgi:hypothetical protein